MQPVLNDGTLIVNTEEGERTELHPPHQNVHQPLVEDFTTAVLENKDPAVNGLVGREVTLILDKIYA